MTKTTDKERKEVGTMKKIIMIIIWGILLLMATVSLFVFVHEFTHYVRYDTSEAMCFGFGGETVGYMYHHTPMSAERSFNEEVIANSVAGIVCLVYLGLTFYMVYGGMKNAKE